MPRKFITLVACLLGVLLIQNSSGGNLYEACCEGAPPDWFILVFRTRPQSAPELVFVEDRKRIEQLVRFLQKTHDNSSTDITAMPGISSFELLIKTSSGRIHTLKGDLAALYSPLNGAAVMMQKDGKNTLLESDPHVRDIRPFLAWVQAIRRDYANGRKDLGSGRKTGAG